MDFNMKAELVSTVVVTLVLFNIGGSMLKKFLGYIKDKTKTKVDNAAYVVIKEGVEKTEKGLDYLLGNTKH